MTDKNHSRTVLIRRFGWLGAVLLLGAALLIPGTSVAAHSGAKCGCTHTSTESSSTTTTSDTGSVSESTTSTETSDVSESTQSTVTTETSDVSESTQSTQTETSDVSETTSVGTSTSDTGGVGGETGRPEVTPPSTSTLPGSSGSSDGWRFILIALAGIAVLSLILLPGDRKKSKQR